MPPRFSFCKTALSAAVFSTLAMVIGNASAQTSPSNATHRIEASKVGDWVVIANTELLSRAIGDMSALAGRPPQEIAAEAQRRALLVGVVSISASADVDAKVIEIRSENVRIQSDDSYGLFFRSLDGKPLSQDEFDAKLRVAQQAARFNNDKLEVRLGNPEGSEMPLAISASPSSDRRYGGALNFSTYGQRYSGRDVITASGYVNMGSDTQLGVTASKGLSDLRDESKGGSYESLTVEANHATRLGVLTARLNDTRYKSGGALLPYDIHGHSTRIDLELDHPISARSSVLFGLGAASSTTEIRQAGLEGRQSFAYGMVGYRYQNGPATFNARLYQGMGGSESFNKAPLGGEFDPHFTALAVDGRYVWDLGSGWDFALSGAAQIGSRGTPAPMQFYGGGLDRGRAFNTGNVSGHSGYSVAGTVSKDIGRGMRMYGGVDYARVYQIGGQVDQSSAFIGVRGNLGTQGATLDLSLAKPIKTAPGESSDPRLMLMLTIPF
jgi:hemolysin activation/secretion protein